MGPSRGDTICADVVIEAIGPMNFGARALGPIHIARTPAEPKMWLSTVERTLLPKSADVSRFMAGVGELARVALPGAVPLVLVDREADFCVVGYRAIDGAQTVGQIAEAGVDEAAALSLGLALARTLAELHRRGFVHGLLTASTVVRAAGTWWTWEHGIAGLCVPDRLAPRLRPLGGDPVAPELRGGAGVSPAADVFGWGAVVACLLTSAVGSEAITLLLEDERDDLLRRLVRVCLDAVPEHRPRDGAALLARVHAIASVLNTAAESSEDSFAELNDVLEDEAVDEGSRFGLPGDPRSLAPPRPPLPEPGAVQHPQGGEESWREIAEQYLAEHPPTHEEVDDLAVADLVVPAPGDRRAGALGRVALIRTRVRTGPQPQVPLDVNGCSGAFEMSDEPEPEPEALPLADEDAPELPLGSDEDEEPWNDPEAAIFDLDAADGPRRLDEEEEVEIDWPSGETAPVAAALATPHARFGKLGADDDTPAHPAPLAWLPPAERQAAAVHADPEQKPDRQAAPAAAAKSVSGPLVVAARPTAIAEAPALEVARSVRPRRGGVTALGFAVLVGAIALAVTLAVARHRGGLSQLLDRAGAIAPAACPAGMRAIDDRACIDEGEFPGLAARPRTQVTLAEAGAACEQRGAQLCNSEQWRRACNRGVFDLEGNVAEWVREGDVLGGDATTRGASCETRGTPAAGARSPTVGFRCCLSQRAE